MTSLIPPQRCERCKKALRRTKRRKHPYCGCCVKLTEEYALAQTIASRIYRANNLEKVRKSQREYGKNKRRKLNKNSKKKDI
tara:strand:+ start:2837 stop:3082 length:246 start_codon:yes stop_codon:yes gene_type:complete